MAPCNCTVCPAISCAVCEARALALLAAARRCSAGVLGRIAKNVEWPHAVRHFVSSFCIHMSTARCCKTWNEPMATVRTAVAYAKIFERQRPASGRSGPSSSAEVHSTAGVDRAVASRPDCAVRTTAPAPRRRAGVTVVKAETRRSRCRLTRISLLQAHEPPCCWRVLHTGSGCVHLPAAARRHDEGGCAGRRDKPCLSVQDDVHGRLPQPQPDRIRGRSPHGQAARPGSRAVCPRRCRPADACDGHSAGQASRALTAMMAPATNASLWQA